MIAYDESTIITIPVRNRGRLAGTEIVQVYVRKVGDVDGPLKTLRGFQRVEVAAGNSKVASIELSPSSFEFYDWDLRGMAVTPGEYEVLYGNSSDMKDLKSLKIEIQ